MYTRSYSGSYYMYTVSSFLTTENYIQVLTCHTLVSWVPIFNNVQMVKFRQAVTGHKPVQIDWGASVSKNKLGC